MGRGMVWKRSLGTEEAAEDRAARRVDRVGDAPVAGDAGIGRGREVAPGLVHHGRLGDDEARPAPRPGAVVGRERRTRQVVLGEARVVPGRDYAVAQGDAAQLEG